jgi:class 3 adenylate cyclase
VGFVVHLVAYVAVNVVFVLVWAAAGDADHSITEALRDPVGALRHDGFWPLWIISGWGALLAVHAAVAAKLRQVRRRRRRRDRAIRRHDARVEARAAASRQRSPASPVGTGRRWVVALFTDVVDSTGLAEALGDDEWNEILLAHRRTVRQLVAEHRGAEVGTQGDGFLVRFDDPADGVACAIALQRRFEEQRGSGAFAPPVRMGLHAGEAVGVEDGDLVGRMVNLASRVTAVARAGEIVVTEPVADQLGADVVLRDNGLHTLKGVERPRHLLSVEWRPELPLPGMPRTQPDADPLQA